ncbi:hypothetical protein Tco_0828641 [Tanacetum coccineum]
MMDPTMEEYMTKTRTDYRSGFAHPKIDDKVNFEIKGQFLKELRDNTFSGSVHEDHNEHIKKVLEISDLFHIPDTNVDQGLDAPTRKILDSRCAIPTMNIADAKKAIHDMANYS